MAKTRGRVIRHFIIFTCSPRILLPDYSDGVEAPRRGRLGEDLPSPRLISTRLALKTFNPTLSIIQNKHNYQMGGVHTLFITAL